MREEVDRDCGVSLLTDNYKINNDIHEDRFNETA